MCKASSAGGRVGTPGSGSGVKVGSGVGVIAGIGGDIRDAVDILLLRRQPVDIGDEDARPVVQLG